MRLLQVQRLDVIPQAHCWLAAGAASQGLPEMALQQALTAADVQKPTLFGDDVGHEETQHHFAAVY